MSGPTYRFLSLGAGVRSSTALLLAEWADAVAFDKAIRNGSARANADGHPLRGQFLLHRQRVPLDEVVLRGSAATAAVVDAPGCGPWTCPHPDEPPPATEPVWVPVSLREVA